LGSEKEIKPSVSEIRCEKSGGGYNIEFENNTLFPFDCMVKNANDMSFSLYSTLGNGVVDAIHIEVTKNSIGIDRDNIISVRSAIGKECQIKVYQSAGDSNLSVDKDNITMPPASSKDTVTVSSNTIFTDQCDVEWIQCRFDNNMLIITTLDNKTNAKREGKITLTTLDKTITREIQIFQSRPNISIGNNYFECDKYTNQTFTRQVYSDLLGWSVKSNSTWCNTTKLNDSEFSFAIIPNNTGADRHAIITVTLFETSTTIDITQFAY
jgi:hypothetical protein